jgi:hypothetical protein
LRGFVKLYGCKYHLFVSLEASIIAHLLPAIIIFLGAEIETKSHNLLVSDALNVSIWVFLPAILFNSFSDLN